MNLWPSSVPASCPFPQSKEFTGIAFTGRHAEYTQADTWYPSWADDGNLYSPYTDGIITPGKNTWTPPPDWEDGKISYWETVPGKIWINSWGTRPASTADNPTDWNTGHAKITGDDPLNLTIEDLGYEHATGFPYQGRYPCGSLVHNGVWYYGTYGLITRHHNSDVQGPFFGFRTSTDYGKTWQPCPLPSEQNLFGDGALKPGDRVKFGMPKFVDFGRNMQHSPDGKAYFIGHGCTDPNSPHGWTWADEIYIARVIPSLDNINRLAAWEFFAGNGQWSNRFADIQPIMRWKQRLGCVTMTYNPTLRRYFTCISRTAVSEGPIDTMILVSETPTGPFEIVTYLHNFGEQAYFVNIPSKFISADGQTMWLCFSANYTNVNGTGTYWHADPPGGRYALCLHEFGWRKG